MRQLLLFFGSFIVIEVFIFGPIRIFRRVRRLHFEEPHHGQKIERDEEQPEKGRGDGAADDAGANRVLASGAGACAECEREHPEAIEVTPSLNAKVGALASRAHDPMLVLNMSIFDFTDA
jgi:hypothetical protein